jgi:NitT/TauT family transport system substrate-binding protein
VGRYPNPDYHLADLRSTRFATVGDVPTPWLCLEKDARQATIDPEQVDRVSDGAMADDLAGLREGRPETAQCSLLP